MTRWWGVVTLKRHDSELSRLERLLQQELARAAQHYESEARAYIQNSARQWQEQWQRARMQWDEVARRAVADAAAQHELVLQQRAEAHQSELAALQQQVEALDRELGKRVVELGELRVDLAESVSASVDKEAALASALAARAGLAQQIDELQADRTALLADVQARAVEQGTQDEVRLRLTRDLEAEREQLSGAVADAADLRVRLEISDSAVAELGEALAAQERLCVEHLAQRNEQQARCETLVAAVSAHHDATSRLQQHAEDLQQHIDALVQRGEGAEWRQAGLEAELAAAAEREGALRSSQDGWLHVRADLEGKLAQTIEERDEVLALLADRAAAYDLIVDELATRSVALFDCERRLDEGAEELAAAELRLQLVLEQGAARERDSVAVETERDELRRQVSSLENEKTELATAVRQSAERVVDLGHVVVSLEAALAESRSESEGDAAEKLVLRAQLEALGDVADEVGHLSTALFAVLDPGSPTWEQAADLELSVNRVVADSREPVVSPRLRESLEQLENEAAASRLAMEELRVQHDQELVGSAALREELQRTSEEVEEGQRIATFLGDRIGQLEDERDHLAAALGEAESRLQEQVSALAAAAGQCEELSDRLATNEQATVSARAELCSWEAKLRDSEEVWEAKLTALEHSRSDLVGELEDERDRLVAALAEADGRLGEHASALAAARGHCDELRERLTASEQASVSARIAELGTWEARLRDSDEQWERKLLALEQSRSGLVRRLEELDAALTASQAEVAAERDRSGAALEHLESVLAHEHEDELRRRAAETRDELNALEGRADSLIRELESERARSQAAGARAAAVGELEGRLEQLSQQLEEERQKREQAEAQRAELEADYTRAVAFAVAEAVRRQPPPVPMQGTADQMQGESSSSPTLADIFDDEDDEAGMAAGQGQPVALDAPHRELLLHLAGAATWPLPEVETRARELDLLLQAALQRINNYAESIIDEPFVQIDQISGLVHVQFSPEVLNGLAHSPA